MLPDSVFVLFVNLLHTMSLVKVRVRLGSDGNYLYIDNGRSRYASDRLRGLRLWRRGFGYRDAQLIEKYGLEFVDLNAGDIVIDCGANYGDVYFSLASLEKQPKYVAIEPDPIVERCLTNNVSCESLVYNIALGAESQSSVRFFLSGMSGDSSVVKPRIVEDEVIVPMQTLTAFVQCAGFEKIGLLKLEAEGYEVEILRGAVKVLERFEYVAVDGSAECDGAETLDECRIILEEHGFTGIYSSSKYLSALFRRAS